MARKRRRCQRYLHGTLNGMQPFFFRSKKVFCDISNSGRGTGTSEVSTAPATCIERYATIFNFRTKKVFCDVSISGQGTGTSEVSTAPATCIERYATIFNFRPQNFFFAISRFFDEARARWRCQRRLQRTLNGMRPFSIFGPKKLFCNISISGRGTGASDVSTAPTKCLDRYATIFNFRTKKVFCDISISGRGTGASDVSTTPTRSPDRYTTIFNFWTKKVFCNISILDEARERRMCLRHLQGALIGIRPFLFFGPKKFFAISRFLD